MPPQFLASRPRCEPSCQRRDDACAYQVAWQINPHMRVGSVHKGHAVRQHRRFVRALEEGGAIVRALPFVHGAYDSVFSKDNAVVVARDGHGALEAFLAHPRHAERKREQLARAQALADGGVRIHGTSSVPLEGGDVVVLPGARGAFLGHGFRSSPRAGSELARFLDGDVVGLELCDPHLYHLDMALSVLDDGTALVCFEALTSNARRTLERHPAIRSIVRVPRVEALRFGVNLVQVGRTILWGADAPRTERALAARGYRVRHVPLDQFHRAGGSAACLVSRIHPQRDVADEAPQSTAA